MAYGPFVSGSLRPASGIGFCPYQREIILCVGAKSGPAVRPNSISDRTLARTRSGGIRGEILEDRIAHLCRADGNEPANAGALWKRAFKSCKHDFA